MERGGAVTESTRPVHLLGAPTPEEQEARITRAPRILLVGGGGALGRGLLEELLRETTADILLADRHHRSLGAAVRGTAEEQHERLSQIELDLWDTDQVTRALVGVQLAICTAEPAYEVPTTLARECMRFGVPHLDLSDDRTFVSKVRALARDRDLNTEDSAVATGWSWLPALSAALVHAGCEDLDTIDSIEVCLAPGARPRLSRARARSLSHAAGQSFKILRHGLWVTVEGWSEPVEFRFPAPVGPRRGRLLDAPDHGVLPELFSAGRVEFRLASPSAFLERALAGLAWVVRRGWVRDGAACAGLLRGGLAFAGGPTAGGLGVQIKGRYGRRPLTKRISIVAEEHVERVALMPATILTRRLLDDPSAHRGLVPHDGWIQPADLRAECERRGLQLIVEEE